MADYLLALLYVVGCVASFGTGIMVGIHDCKRTFGIPKGALGVEEDGTYFYWDTRSILWLYSRNNRIDRITTT